MRFLIGTAVVMLVALTAQPAAAMRARPAVPCPGGEAPLFAAGGTFVSNGYFFPGTAIYDGQDFVGAAYRIDKGCNLRFVNLDVSAVTNGHKIVSFARRCRNGKIAGVGEECRRGFGKPLFQSAVVNGPQQASVKTARLKPGSYPYFCSIHAGMYGLLEVVEP